MMLYVLAFLFLVGVDQLTKWIAMVRIPLGVPIDAIPYVMGFTYVKNYGAAFGILENARVFFIITTVIVLLLLALYLWRVRPKTEWERLSILLLSAGAVGNLIDRIALGFVRDFIELRFVRFPVFNVADCCVCAGAVLLVLGVCTMTTKKEEDGDGTDADG